MAKKLLALGLPLSVKKKEEISKFKQRKKNAVNIRCLP